MPRYRRALHPDNWPGGAAGCEPSWSCPSPPPRPSDDYIVLTPAPSPSPLCPPVSVPSPSQVHGASGGRRDQGGSGAYGAPPVVGADDHTRHYIKYVIIAATVFAFVSFLLLGVSVAVRRRQVRRRRQALLVAAAAEPGVDHVGNDPEGGGGGGGVVHHVWNIRTVGLDEAAIASIPFTRYHAGAGLLGAADCSVCLGEFQDGELVRLLPRCAHAFHVPCVDTWLRAHVNCPLCRSDVLDPAVTTTATEGGGGDSSSVAQEDPAANTHAAAEQAGAGGRPGTDPAPEHEEAESGLEESSPLQDVHHVQSRSPEPPPPQPQPPCPSPRNVRRSTSMDAVIVSAAAQERLPEAVLEEEQGGRRKRGCTGAPGAKASGSAAVPRSFFSRHSRARSSVLPL